MRKTQIAAVAAAGVAVFVAAFVIMQVVRGGDADGAADPAGSSAASSLSGSPVVSLSGSPTAASDGHPPAVTSPTVAAVSPSRASSAVRTPTSTALTVVTADEPLPRQGPPAAALPGVALTPIVEQTAVTPSAVDLHDGMQVVVGFVQTAYGPASTDSAQFNTASRSARFTTKALYRRLVDQFEATGPWAGFGQLYAVVTKAYPAGDTNPGAVKVKVAVSYYTYIQPADGDAKLVNRGQLNVHLALQNDLTWRVEQVSSAAG